MQLAFGTFMNNFGTFWSEKSGNHMNFLYFSGSIQASFWHRKNHTKEAKFFTNCGLEKHRF